IDPSNNNTFSFDVYCDRFPLYIASYWIGDATSDIIGDVSSDVRFFGTPEQVNIEGDALVDNAAITIDYLQTRYFIDSQKVYFDNFFFDTRGAEIKDIYGNTGNLYGGFRHQYLKKFVLDGRAKSDYILGLNTSKGDNDAYYGQGFGSVDATFRGPLKATNIYVNAVAGEGSKIYIPIDDSEGGSEISFVRFVNRDSTKVEEEEDVGVNLLEGIDVKMDLTLTDQAEAEIIFDEFAGEILKGRGQGNLQINVSREGEFEMFGDYSIENGIYNYTFLNTAFNAALNKEFIIAQGSNINWTGDPYNATVDIDANYLVKNTSPRIILQELLIEGTNSDIDSRNSTDVLLNMNLTGLLLQPNVEFD
ncbi:MAG: translocation/assembly module TamB domain-containing protein, partial [Bacteroidota bacterium]